MMASSSETSSERAPSFSGLWSFAKFRRRVRQAKDYVRLLRLFLTEVFTYFRWRSLKIGLGGVCQLATKFGAMGIMFIVVRYFETQEPISVLGLELTAEDQYITLTGGILCILALLIATSIARYAVRSQSIALGRGFEELCVRRFVTLASLLPHPRAEWANRQLKSGVLPQVIPYSRQCGMVARALANSIPSMGGLLIGAGLVLWIDPRLTLTLASIALLVVAVQYWPNRRAAKASGRLHRHRKEAAQHIKLTLNHLRKAPTPLPAGSTIVDRLVENEDVRTSMDAFTRRVHASEKAMLYSRIGTSVILTTTLLLLGIEILDGEVTWSAAAVYLAALRFALRDFTAVSKLFTSINRFHAQIDTYYGFVDSASNALKDGGVRPKPVSWPLVSRLPGLDSGARDRPIEPGAVLAMVAPLHRETTVPSVILDTIKARNGGLAPVPFHVAVELLSARASLRDNLGLPQAVTREQLEPYLSGTAVARELSDLLGKDWLDAEPPKPWDQALSPLAISMVQVAAARLRQSPIIYAKTSLLKKLGDSSMAPLIAAAPDSVWIIVYSDLTMANVHKIGSNGERHVILCDDERARLWADPPDSPAAAEALVKSAAALQAANRQAKQAEEEDDDDIE